ncbi:Cytochrome c [Gemmata obscuriglobus]|nr:cytochrome c [Gemmata obscuriglobus]QEG28407.1 Cytochrome c [Gemmata obscuriglobus]VTS06351.1 cytochrome c class i : C-type cytochrome OS=uncultured planctomycete GN=HGMM_F22C11C34 PE=4 SV=1: Cytochrome_CBB3 [Gemmata obscuriglobus UQM 2246]
MTNSRWFLACVGVAAFGFTGCGGSTEGHAPQPAAATAPPTTRYAPRTDLMAVKIPDGAPAHWSAARFPPLKSVRLMPHTPDADLATDLRKQFGKNILDPIVYEQDVWMPAQADRLARVLDAHFGTPAAPTVVVPELNHLAATSTVRFDPTLSLGANLKEAQKQFGKAKFKELEADRQTASEMKRELKLDDATLARGAVLYRRWCMQCHGPSGAGDAAYAIEAGPMPRDYRQGAFKYTTVLVPATAPKKAGLGAAGKPLRSDLVRTVRNGIDGTMMPAFPSLTAAELDDVISYVIHLSVRGEVEFAALARAIKPGGDDPIYEGAEMDWLVAQTELAVLYNWSVAAKHPIPVPAEPVMTEKERIDSAVRGYRLYNSPEFGCGSCHANYGRAQQLKWDIWGTIVQPRNLTLGVYRGGRKGEDLYARIYGGIAPSGMTAFHDRVTNAAPGSPNKIWDVVHFLQALGDAGDRRRMQERDAEIKFDP